MYFRGRSRRDLLDNPLVILWVPLKDSLFLAGISAANYCILVY